MPKISIITINLNNKIGLEKTILSVLSQTVKDVEFIIIDGGSNDGSIELIKKYTDNITYSISEKDAGIYDAQNKGIEKASGNFLLFLNSGDILFDKNTLSGILPLLENKSFYYGNLIVDLNGKRTEHIAPDNINLDFILNSTFWHPCVFINANLFKKYGYYNTDFKITGDYEFFIRCLLKPKVTCEKLNSIITVFDGYGISSNHAHRDIQAAEREKALRLNLSDNILESLKKYNALSRSNYLTIINFIQRIRGKQKF
jgi:glycosyltransferase involved in cell wall biosynthesis